MSVILLILGIVVAATGIATIGFGIPISDFALGTTLIITGTTALTGGLVLIGLSAVVTELGRVTEGLKVRAGRTAASRVDAAEASQSITEPATQPIIASQPAAPQIVQPVPSVPPAAGARVPPSMPRTAPEPSAQPRAPEHYPAPSAVEVSAAAIERLRSSIPRERRADPSEVADVEGVPLSPNGGAAHPRAPQPRSPVAEAPAPEPQVSAEQQPASPEVEALRASRLDFLFRSKPRPQHQPENFDAFWPADGRGARSAPAAVEPAAPRSDYAPPAQRHPQVQAQPQGQVRAQPQEQIEQGGPTILKSGVVDSMAYTLYSDGSIEAKLPHGTVRFGSIAELRAHIESNT